MVRNFGKRKTLFNSAARAFLNFVNLISFHGIPYTSPYTKPYFYEAMIMELLRRNYGEAMDILWILSCWNRFVFCTLTAWLLHIYCIRTAEFDASFVIRFFRNSPMKLRHNSEFVPIIYTHSIDYFEAGYMLFKRKKRRHLPTINVKQDAFLLINCVHLVRYFVANRVRIARNLSAKRCLFCRLFDTKRTLIYVWGSSFWCADLVQVVCYLDTTRHVGCHRQTHKSEQNGRNSSPST